MSYPSPELIDRLAAEYALGTLRGPARQRFARWIAQHPDAARATRLWEDRLSHLADDVRPVTPSPAVWRAIEQRTTGAAPGGAAAPRWRVLALAASLLLAVGILWVSLRAPQPEWQVAAELRDTQAAQVLWRIEFDRDGATLRASALRPYPLPADRAHELWALPGGGEAPVSLGLLPQTGSRQLALDDRQLAALRQAGQLAVSVEPSTGSPTGAPTGPVVNVSPRLPIA